MIPWIQVYSNLPQHPKTSKLADELGLTSAALNPNVLAVGLIVSLWTWAIQNAYSGDLSGCSPRAIAEACLWKKKPETLVKALVSAGFLDKDMKLHDWDEYACQLMDQEEARKAKTRERVKRYRDKKASDCGVTGNDDCNVTNALRNGNVTIPPSSPPLSSPQTPYLSPPYYPPVPDRTEPDLTRPDQIFCGGGGYAGAGARESDLVSEFLQDRGIDQSIYFGVTEELKAQADTFAAQVFRAFVGREPSPVDCANVLASARRTAQRPDGRWESYMDEEAQKLLMYAFEASGNAGKAGDWNYIFGVLGRLHRRSIGSLDQAEDFDADRMGGH